jgi:hypothetical protein
MQSHNDTNNSKDVTQENNNGGMNLERRRRIIERFKLPIVAESQETEKDEDRVQIE